MPIDKFRRAPAHPLDEGLHLGVLPGGLRGGIVRGQFFGGKKGVEFAVADQVQGLGLAAAPGPGLPVVPVDTGPRDHFPAANRAGAQKLPRVRWNYWSIYLIHKLIHNEKDLV
jgi:hypothetical protein